MVFRYVITPPASEVSPPQATDAQDSTSEGSLPMTSGNSLLPMSYLPFEGKVYGVISDPVNYTDLCGVDYLGQWWGKETENASKICVCESRGQWWAVNDNGKEKSVGIFQINTLIHNYSVEYLKVPENNVKEAVKIYNARGNFEDWYNCGKATGVIQ